MYTWGDSYVISSYYIYASCLSATRGKLREILLHQFLSKTRMWADAQRDGRPAEYKWRRLRKFRNSIPCTTPQSLADARCWSAVQ